MLFFVVVCLTQVACCGSEGPNDYLNLRQPLPIECRDTITGHAFANGCVDELTWYLEDKSIWAAAMAMSLAMIHVSIPHLKNLENHFNAIFFSLIGRL